METYMFPGQVRDKDMLKLLLDYPGTNVGFAKTHPRQCQRNTALSAEMSMPHPGMITSLLPTDGDVDIWTMGSDGLYPLRLRRPCSTARLRGAP
ncbi:hypothetical protein MAPG_11547 [Magnaporthiopsis poae ATCC 64411]|uniref:Uncharacterized protein n=1 Tax=Magnaporthiopsis poae (strain ATCC 64411 / 73-15) TaxID=644358 RepID=A0A0C4EFJ6_MAGP6|nr:hypothetical protein MAPG_11547 [Magnaporthiopsis poae ATCC 64411]